MTADLPNFGDIGTAKRLLDEQQGALPVSIKPDDVPIENRRDEDLDEADPNTLIEKQYNIADLAVAASFDAPLPGAVSMLHSTLIRTQEIHGEYSISNGGGPIGQLTKEELAEQRDKEAADDLNEMFEAVERRERERIETDRAATLTEQQIDAMAWVGDPDEVWTLGDMSVSRKSLLAGAKSARAKIKDKVASGEMTEAEGTHETRLLSEYEVANKNDDHQRAAEIRRQMTPGTQELADQGARTAEASAKGVTNETTYHATSAAQKMSVSTDAGADFLSQKAVSLDAQPPKAAPTRLAGLSNPPDIELTKDFTVAAVPTAHDAAPSAKPVLVGQANPAATARLSQNYDI